MKAPCCLATASMSSLLQQARRAGVEIWPDGINLRFRGPVGAKAFTEKWIAPRKLEALWHLMCRVDLRSGIRWQLVDESVQRAHSRFVAAMAEFQ